MEFKEILQTRKTHKDYSGKIYDNEKIQEIINDINLTPSSFGTEPWEVVVVRNEGEGKKLIEKLSPFMWNQPCLKTASHILFVFYRNQRNFVPNADYLVDYRNKADGNNENTKESANANSLRLLNHIHENENSVNSWSRQQTYILLANILNSATDHNLGSTPIEGMDYVQIQEQMRKENLADFNLLNLSYAVALGESIEKTLPRRRFKPENKFKFYN